MSNFADDLAALATALEAAAVEAQKRRDLRTGEGRDLPPELRGQLERCQLALAAVLAPAAPAPARTAAELRAVIDALAVAGDRRPVPIADANSGRLG